MKNRSTLSALFLDDKRLFDGKPNTRTSSHEVQLFPTTNGVVHPFLRFDLVRKLFEDEEVAGAVDWEALLTRAAMCKNTKRELGIVEWFVMLGCNGVSILLILLSALAVN